MNKQITHGEKYGRAMQIHDQATANSYFEELVAHQMSFGLSTRQEAERIERENLGYWAGYFNAETRERVERLFRCQHPIFGSIAKNGSPTPDQAFSAGLSRGRASTK